MSSWSNFGMHGLSWRAARPPFIYADGRLLTRERFVSSIRSALPSKGLDTSPNSGHSFRICTATAAALNGVPDSLTKTMGRWECSVYTMYIRIPGQDLVCSRMVRRLCNNLGTFVLFTVINCRCRVSYLILVHFGQFF